MSAQHTPGPWSADSRGGGVIKGSKIYEYARGANTRQLALACLHDDLGPEERDANVCLIAAAPELLAACEEAVDFYNTIGSPHTDGLRERARAALAKARGGA